MEAAWAFLPAIGAALTHAPVLRWNLCPRLAVPLDGGRRFRGRRILGDNKTLRGAVVMLAGVVLATLASCALPAYVARLPAELRAAPPALFGLLLGLGVVLGELPNSFIKRQLGVAPGRQRRGGLGLVLSLLDQGDIVLGAWVTLTPLWRMSVGQAATAFAAVVAAHMVVNVIGYTLGIRKSWR
jgi:CDP-2,3-bis-(O-geranylgeranyl)-sn-glycerol synthase